MRGPSEHREAIKLDPGVPTFHNNYGLSLQAKGDLAGTEREHREAAKLDAKKFIYYFRLGIVLNLKGGLTRVKFPAE